MTPAPCLQALEMQHDTLQELEEEQRMLELSKQDCVSLRRKSDVLQERYDDVERKHQQALTALQQEHQQTVETIMQKHVEDKSATLIQHEKGVYVLKEEFMLREREQQIMALRNLALAKV